MKKFSISLILIGLITFQFPLLLRAEGSRLANPESAAPSGSNAETYGSAYNEMNQANNTILKSNQDAEKGVSQAQTQGYIAGAMCIATGVQMISQSTTTFGISSIIGGLMVGMGIFGVTQAMNMEASKQDLRNMSDFLKEGAKPLAAAGISTSALKEMGVPSPDQIQLPKNMKYDPAKKQITMPNGRIISESAFANKAAAMAAGIPGDLYDKAAAEAEKISKDVKEKHGAKIAQLTGGDFEEGGGGRAVAGKSSVAVDPLGKIGLVHNPAKTAGDVKDPLALSGATKTYNGEPIGVASDSIFVMISRRYQLKDTQDNFIQQQQAVSSPAADFGR